MEVSKRMVSAMNLHPLTPEQKNEYTRIAYYYYEAGQTQDQIAQRLGISRQRVNRILAECIERGIVRITVDRSPEEYFASESALEDKYRLKAVRLAHSLGADQLYGNLGVVAGQYLKSIVKRGDIIGCVPGRGVAGLVDNMPQMERTGLTVTQLMGSESRREYNLEVDSILHRFARKLSALPQPLYAPVLVSNAELRESIVREPYYQEAYAVMKRCTVAVVGIGTATTYEQYITGANRQPGTAAARRLRWGDMYPLLRCGRTAGGVSLFQPYSGHLPRGLQEHPDAHRHRRRAGKSSPRSARRCAEAMSTS